MNLYITRRQHCTELHVADRVIELIHVDGHGDHTSRGQDPCWGFSFKFILGQLWIFRDTSAKVYKIIPWNLTHMRRWWLSLPRKMMTIESP